MIRMDAKRAEDYQRNGTTDAERGREVWTSYEGSKQTRSRGRLQSDRAKIFDGEGSRTDPCSCVNCVPSHGQRQTWLLSNRPKTRGGCNASGTIPFGS